MKQQIKQANAAILFTLLSATAFAQTNLRPQEKCIYTPKELKDNDFTNDSSQWSFKRMAASPNFVVFWEKGFGDDLAKAPDLDGHNMKVDLKKLLEKLETFYAFYKDSMQFVLPGSKTEKYKMMAMLNYSLEATAYGGAYDNEIGALWVSPNRIQDTKLNCIAHEVGHSFQLQIPADGKGVCWGGGGIFEMASQWMLWNVNPEWVTDENYHWQDFKKNIYLPFLAPENIYHSPYVLEYWSMKHGPTVIADLFRESRTGEDPAITYMRKYIDNTSDGNMPYTPSTATLDRFAFEILDCYSRLITFDFPRVKAACKPHINQLHTDTTTSGPQTKEKGGKQKESFIYPLAEQYPQTYGFNVIELDNTLLKQKLRFCGDGDETRDGFAYKIVYSDDEGNVKYSETMYSFKKTINIAKPSFATHTYLVVVGYPKDCYKPMSGNPYEQQEKEPARVYKYHLQK